MFVRNYHVYSETWEAAIGEELLTTAFTLSISDGNKDKERKRPSGIKQLTDARYNLHLAECKDTCTLYFSITSKENHTCQT